MLLRSLVMLVMLVATAPLLAAQQRVDTSRLAPVVVTASRTSIAQNVATTATTVLSGESLRARGITTVGAALREIPGTTVAQTGGAGSQTSLFLRGGEADYVQVMIDGVTINEPGGAFNYANLGLDNVDRIEVVRGPASVLYGSSAVTGVIQIFTRGGEERSGGELRLRAGQRSLRDAEVSAGVGSRATSLWVGGGHRSSAGIFDLNNDMRASTASGRLRLSPASAMVVNLTGRYADARFNYPTEYWGAVLDSNSYNTERRLSAGVDMLYAVRPAVDIRVIAGLSRFQNITNDPIEGRTGSVPDDGSPVAFETRSVRRNVEAQADVRVIPGATLTIGGEYDWQRLEDDAADALADTLRERASAGLYGQLIGNAGTRFTYSIGGRIEDNERFGNLGNVRLGAGVAVTSGTTLRLSGGTAFKEPQFLEITGGGFALANPSLRPERSRSWEVGLEQRLVGESLAIGATYFDQSFTEMILFVSENTDAGFISQYRNAQSAESRGLELEARAAIAGSISARASFTFVNADFRATDATPSAPLPRRASRTGSLVLTMPVTRHLLVSGDVSYVGPRPDLRFFPGPPFSEAEELPAYSLFGIAGTYNIAALRNAANVELMARVDNLLDERYEAVAGFATPRRTASVGVRISARR